MLRVFIGYDSSQVVAFHVCAHSIIARASSPVAITPIKLDQVPQFDRPREGSTEFSFSRFLVPWMSGYDGQSVFMDCDMLMRGDIRDLAEQYDPWYTVMCVHHNHVPKETKKFLNQDQHKYNKKNWSSLMIFNNERW